MASSSGRVARGNRVPVGRCVWVVLLAVASLVVGCRAGGRGADGPETLTRVDAPTSTPTERSTTEISPSGEQVSPSAAAAAAVTATPTPKPPTLTSTPEPTATVTPTLAPLIAIDPGHGGRDLGARHFDASGHMDFYESQVNLDIALGLRGALLARGYRVLMIRDDDYAVNSLEEDITGDGEADSLDELQMRLDLVNEQHADLLLSIHQNAFYWEDGEPAGDVGGTVTYYCSAREFAEQNLLYATLTHEAIVEAFHELGYDIHDRGVEPDHELDVPGAKGSHLVLLGPESERILRPSEMVGILSETLFITNEREAEMARDPQVIDRLVVAYADAIDRYFDEPGALAE